MYNSLKALVAPAVVFTAAWLGGLDLTIRDPMLALTFALACGFYLLTYGFLADCM